MKHRFNFFKKIFLNAYVFKIITSHGFNSSHANCITVAEERDYVYVMSVQFNSNNAENVSLLICIGYASYCLNILQVVNALQLK